MAAVPLSTSSIAQEPNETPTFAVALRETDDVWEVPAGNDPGLTILNKMQVSATLDGTSWGFDGWTAHAQIFRFDGKALSDRMGDIQTADNLEAPPTTRLFEAWVARQWGRENRSVALRLGLIDLNSQFDSVDPASLFINSSHGIAPDLSRSGRNGPSIYPVSSFGTTLTLVPSDRWTFRVGVFDGVPGDPAHPRAFVAERLAPADGALIILQTDYQLSKKARIEAGAWKYSARVPDIDVGRAHDQGMYMSLEAPFPVLPRTAFWVRAGIGNGHAQAVAGYLGAGIVQSGTFAGRSDDRLGFAIAHAIIGKPAVEALALSSAETSLEATYQLKVSERIALQPDVQYLLHPAGVAGARNSLGVGLRVVVAAGFPKKPQANDPSDPTVPPDGAPTTSPSDTQDDSTPPSS